MDISERNGEVSRRHPWELARSHFFSTVLQREGAVGTSTTILDVGAGDAWFSQQLLTRYAQGAQITCWDINYDDEILEVGASDVSGLTMTAEKPLSRFNGLLMLDVIEHVEDDVGFVQEIVRDLMDENGWALVSVPAYQRLYTSHDTALHHYRRYSPGQCRRVLRSAGLVPVLQGGLYQSLLFIRGLQALRELVAPPPSSHGIGAWEGGEVQTKAMTRWLDYEGRLSIEVATRTGFTLPGLSYWAFCVPSSG